MTRRARRRAAYCFFCVSVVEDAPPEEPEAPLSDALPEVDPDVPPELLPDVPPDADPVLLSAAPPEDVLGLDDELLPEAPLDGWSVELDEDDELGVEGVVTDPEAELELGLVLGVALEPELEDELGLLGVALELDDELGVLGVALDPELDELLGEDMLPLAPPLALPEGDAGELLLDDDEAPRLASGPRSQP